MKLFRASLASCLLGAAAWKTRWFQQPIDHRGDVGNFTQRYLLADNVKEGHGPLLFFCGNEGDVEAFANFSGFVLEAAAALGGEPIFAEHRFYGQSLPFGPDFTIRQSEYLTVEQALADYAQLIRFLVPDAQRAQRPVLVFGGSYGGMLSSWMRVRYPELVFAAVASSSPLHFDGVKRFFPLVTQAAEANSPGCAQRVRRGFAALSHRSGRNWGNLEVGKDLDEKQKLQKAFGLCGDDFQLDELILWARNAFVTVAMGNYPYAQDLFGQGLQAWPLRIACAQPSQSALEFLAKAVGSYYNATGRVLCHNITAEYRDCADQTGCGTLHSAWGRSWDVEACRQIVYWTSTDNVSDMFPPRAWGPRELAQYCQQTWDISPQTEWFRPWMAAVENSSRIIFTNGLGDPWRSGGVLKSLSSSLVSLQIPQGGHMYDLAASHPKDLPGVRVVRRKVVSLLRKWLSKRDTLVV